MASILKYILLCALPESLYFSLFMILAKNIKEKRFLFCVLMFLEYAILVSFIQYNVWFQIIYTFMTFLILKLLYKEKAIITDIFAFALASIFLIITSAVSYMIVYYTFNIYAIAYILNRILMFFIFFLFRNKLNKWYRKFNSLWNRKPNSKIRSLTIRNISIIIFNLMFYIINFGIIYFLMNFRK